MPFFGGENALNLFLNNTALLLYIGLSCPLKGSLKIDKYRRLHQTNTRQ